MCWTLGRATPLETYEPYSPNSKEPNGGHFQSPMRRWRMYPTSPASTSSIPRAQKEFITLAKHLEQHCVKDCVVTCMVRANITAGNSGTATSFNVCRCNPPESARYWRRMLLDAFARSISALARLRAYCATIKVVRYRPRRTRAAGSGGRPNNAPILTQIKVPTSGDFSVPVSNPRM